MFKVHVWNLGKYNEGELVGGWINLPTSEKKIKEFLTQVVELNANYEEYMISDYEIDLNYSPFEYDNIYNLNLLAKASERIMDLEKINCYLDTRADFSISEIINVILQEENIPYYDYGMDNSIYMDKEEKYGYAMADVSGISDILENYKISDYFDYKRYGDMCRISDSVELFDNGYINLSEEIDLDYYSLDEIKEILNKDEKCMVKNQSFSEMECD